MEDGRKNNRGTIGNKAHTGIGYGQLEVIKKNLNKYSPVFWEKLGGLMEKGDKWALAEFNKIQIKTIPQDITSKGEQIKIPIYGGEAK